MNDQLDVHLEDAELLEEVELTTNLIIAASESHRRLTQTEIDCLLGVPPRFAGVDLRAGLDGHPGRLDAAAAPISFQTTGFSA